MDNKDWLLGLIVYLLAAIVAELNTGGWYMYRLSIVIILWGMAAYVLYCFSYIFIYEL